MSEAVKREHPIALAAATAGVDHERVFGNRIAALKAEDRYRVSAEFERSASPIVPAMVGDPVVCKAASDCLLAAHAIHVQPINYL